MPAGRDSRRGRRAAPCAAQTSRGVPSNTSKRPSLTLLEPALTARIRMDPLMRPRPIADFRHVIAVFHDVALVPDELIAQVLLEVRRHVAQAGDAVHRVAGQVK